MRHRHIWNVLSRKLDHIYQVTAYCRGRDVSSDKYGSLFHGETETSERYQNNFFQNTGVRGENGGAVIRNYRRLVTSAFLLEFLCKG